MYIYRDEAGWTPLMYAAAHVRSDLVAMLLSRGADCLAMSFCDFKLAIEVVGSLLLPDAPEDEEQSLNVSVCIHIYACCGFAFCILRLADVQMFLLFIRLIKTTHDDRIVRLCVFFSSICTNEVSRVVNLHAISYEMNLKQS